MNLLRRMIRPSLRTKFLVPITALLAVSISIVSIYLLERQADSYRRELETSGETNPTFAGGGA